MGQRESSAPRYLGEGAGGTYGRLTPRLALGHLWAPDRMGTAPFPRDLGSDLAPPPPCADWLNLPCAPPPTSNQAVVTMVTGRLRPVSQCQAGGRAAGKGPKF